MLELSGSPLSVLHDDLLYVNDEKERERQERIRKEKKRLKALLEEGIYTHIYTYIHAYMCIYIYIICLNFIETAVSIWFCLAH